MLVIEFVHRARLAEIVLDFFRARLKAIQAQSKTFKSLSKKIRRITRSDKVFRYLVNQRVSWNFIVERAGGREVSGSA